MPQEEVLGYWLGHGPRPLPLRKTDVVTMGREPQNALPLEDTFASRHHAVIEVTPDGQVLLKDLKSSNGTYLNEKRLDANEPTPLRSGDLIRIGGKVFTFISNQPGLEPRKVGMQAYRDLAHMQTRSMDKPDLPPPPDEGTKKPGPRSTEALQTLTNIPREQPKEAILAGSLEDQSLPQILQFLNSSAKTGELAVNGKSEEGRIAFQDGTIFYATTSSQLGDDAVYACSRIRSGTFRFTRQEFPPDLKRNVKEKTIHLIFECCRRIDEESGKTPPSGSPQA